MIELDQSLVCDTRSKESTDWYKQDREGVRPNLEPAIFPSHWRLRTLGRWLVSDQSTHTRQGHHCILWSLLEALYRGDVLSGGGNRLGDLLSNRGSHDLGLAEKLPGEFGY